MLLRDEKSQTEANCQFLQESEKLWNGSSCSVNEKLESFPKYVSRESLTKFLARSELFKMQTGIQGSIVELGVARGASLFAWAQMSSIFEPNNYNRQVIGFDTFSGIPRVSAGDLSSLGVSSEVRVGGFAVCSGMHEHLERAAAMHDATRFLGHIPKVRIIPGEIEVTVPEYLRLNPHLIISLLHIDTDLYSPTRIAFSELLPRVPKGGIVVCDELNDRRFPGETLALREMVGIGSVKLERLPFCPTLSFWVRS